MMLMTTTTTAISTPTSSTTSSPIMYNSSRSSSNGTATTTSRVMLGRRGMMTTSDDFNSRRILFHSSNNNKSSSRNKRKALTLRANAASASKGEVSLLDYGAGNVRSVRNAMQKLWYTVKDIKSPEDILEAKKLVFPGVGAYGSAMDILRERKLIEPLREYVLDGTKPFMGVCLGLQLLFDGS